MRKRSPEQGGDHPNPFENGQRIRPEIQADRGLAIEAREHEPKELLKSETERIDEIRRSIQEHGQHDEVAKPELISEYINRFLPIEAASPSLIRSLATGALGMVQKAGEILGFSRVDGRENIPPTGAFLLVSNHSGGETFPLLATFGERNIHISAGQTLNFERSRFRAWMLRKLGMISVPESLEHLSEEEKARLFERVPTRSKAGYRKVMEHPPSLADGRRFIRESVESLLKGEPVAIFPEGLFLYEGRSLRKAYGGAELIAKEYRRITGEDLPVLSVAVDGKKDMHIGKATTFDLDKDIHFVMRQIAQLLPEEERGYYKA